MHLLMLAPFFPPRRRVGALRPFRLATHLADRGHRVTVVHIAAGHDTLTPLEQQRLRGVELLPIGSVPEGRRQAQGRRTARDGEAKTGFVGWFDRHFPVDTFLPVLTFAYPRLLRRLAEHRFDVLWSTADPWSSHLLAGALAERLRIPWAADFRDPWSLCAVRAEGRPGWVRAMDARAERWVLERATAITFTARSTYEQYTGVYPQYREKLSWAPNGFDAALCRPVTPPLGAGRRRLRLLFLGRFRALSSTARVLKLVQGLAKGFGESLCLAALGRLSPVEAGQLQAACPGIDYQELAPLPYEDLADHLSLADIALVSTSPGRSQIIPAKFWDYLSCGRPILSLCDNPEIEEILTSTGTGLQPGEAEASRWLEAAVERWRQGHHPNELIQPNQAAIERYEASRQAVQWETFLTQLQAKAAGAPPPFADPPARAGRRTCQSATAATHPPSPAPAEATSVNP